MEVPVDKNMFLKAWKQIAKENKNLDESFMMLIINVINEAYYLGVEAGRKK